ncbi:MAG TPA: GNAT family N-acetyltransferase [Edaphobacter sp.]|jgi:ribosomal protein S18 acetylase RimI-like enzyme|nr:GNAT family N-acetyltransferase [Edaphobacter sp.]
MQVRKARREDLPEVMELIRRVVPLMQKSGNFQWDAEYPNIEVFERDIERDQLWVAVSGGKTAAIAAITTEQEPEYVNVGWDISEPAVVVHRLAVDPAFRGQGAAMDLMLQAELVAKQRDIRVLRVDTNTRNEATQRLFPKLGYVLAGETALGFRPALRFRCYEKRLSTETV